jgi:peptidoglycan/LPS O-acetylase OafA/YrhL
MPITNLIGGSQDRSLPVLMPSNSLPWQNPRLTGRVIELDGLRGLAILLVLVHHYIGKTVVGIVPGSWQARSIATLRLTWSGVDLFFVLSGFLIGGILYDARHSKSYFRTFYGRRMYRIFPLYFINILILFIALNFVSSDSPNPLRQIFNHDLPLWSYPFFLQNFCMVFKQIWGPSWMAVTWSLAVEEQFYLLLPIMVRNLSFRIIRCVAVASILAAPLARIILALSGDQVIGQYTLSPARADALGFGVLIALICRNKNAWDWLTSHRSCLYAAFLALGCGMLFLLKYQRFVYTAGITWIAAFYASLLLVVVVNPGWIETAFFRSGTLVKLGTMSYAIYIFHQGINALFHFAIFGRTPMIADWPSLFVTLVSLITVLLLSELSWRLIEKPLIRHANQTYRY